MPELESRGRGFLKDKTNEIGAARGDKLARCRAGDKVAARRTGT